MRLRLVLLLSLSSLLPLAACHRAPNFDRPDGGFDRAAYFNYQKHECSDGMRRDNPMELPLMIDRMCGCVTDRLMGASSDADLRGFLQSGSIPSDRMQAAQRQCGMVPGRPLPPYGLIPETRPSPGSQGRADSPFDVDETPPPPEPAPGASTDGPNAGGGATVPAGARARALANLGSYLTPDDYPAAALLNDEHGRVTFALDIGPDGRVTNCAILESSGSATLDSATCRIMRARPRFAPARDARGRAVADRTTAAVTWALPTE